jgi:hypothetical protein
METVHPYIHPIIYPIIHPYIHPSIHPNAANVHQRGRSPKPCPIHLRPTSTKSLELSIWQIGQEM